MRCPLLFYLKIIHTTNSHISLEMSSGIFSLCWVLSLVFIMISIIKPNTQQKEECSTSDEHTFIGTYTQRQTNKQNAIWWKTNLFIVSPALSLLRFLAFYLGVAGLWMYLLLCEFIQHSTLHCSNGAAAAAVVWFDFSSMWRHCVLVWHKLCIPFDVLLCHYNGEVIRYYYHNKKNFFRFGFTLKAEHVQFNIVGWLLAGWLVCSQCRTLSLFRIRSHIILRCIPHYFYVLHENEYHSVAEYTHTRHASGMYRCCDPIRSKSCLWA